jgi:hypothetical protein
MIAAAFEAQGTQVLCAFFLFQLQTMRCSAVLI